MVTHIIDDIDGSPDAAELRFAYDGVEYSIDLNTSNRKAFDESIQPYINVARAQTRRRASRAAANSVVSKRRDLRAVREWAAAQGIEVSPRGRVPAAVFEQYDAVPH